MNQLIIEIQKISMPKKPTFKEPELPKVPKYPTVPTIPAKKIPVKYASVPELPEEVKI